MSIQAHIKKYKITRDKGVDLKRLKKLEKARLIEIFDVKIENETKKVPNKILPVGVWNHSEWDECIWGGDDSSYDDIRQTIGKENVKDAMHLEAKFPRLKIVTINELEELCQK